MPAAVESMAYFGETPWHKLGVQSLTAMTAEEALIKGGLNWQVEKRPIFLEDGTEVKGSYAVVRDIDNKPLGVVGERYEPVQNKDAFRFYDPFVTRKEAHFHTVGSLHGGRRIWLLSKLPGTIRILGEDLTEQYLLLTNSHDGSSGIEIKLTPIRVVCQNTLTAALSGQGLSYKLRHTANVLNQMDQASRVMGIANTYFDELGEAFESLARVELNGSETRSYLERCFSMTANVEERSTKDKQRLEALERLVEVGAGADIRGVRGTAWGAYNAVTEYVDHAQKYRSDDSRLASVWFDGSGQQTKQRAFELALALAR